MTPSKGLLPRLTLARNKLERRFQASDFVREGGDGYALASDICGEVMQHIREAHRLIDEVETLVRTPTPSEAILSEDDAVEIYRQQQRIFNEHNDVNLDFCWAANTYEAECILRMTLRVLPHLTPSSPCERMRKELANKYKALVAFYDKHYGTPCEQIRHHEEVAHLVDLLNQAHTELYFDNEDGKRNYIVDAIDDVLSAHRKLLATQSASPESFDDIKPGACEIRGKPEITSPEPDVERRKGERRIYKSTGTTFTRIIRAGPSGSPPDGNYYPLPVEFIECRNGNDRRIAALRGES